MSVARFSCVGINMKLSKSLLTAAVSLAAFGAQAATSHLQNGSFEDGTNVLLPFWSITVGPLPQVDIFTSGAQEGSRYIDLDTIKSNPNAANPFYSNRTISQTFTGSGLVNLSFWYKANSADTGSTNQVNFSLGTFTGSVMGGPNNDSTNWTHYSQPINLGLIVASQALSFAAAGAADNKGGYIDHVSVTSVTAVPEPESFAMMLAGLALMGSIALRRNKDKSV